VPYFVLTPEYFAQPLFISYWPYVYTRPCKTKPTLFNLFLLIFLNILAVRGDSRGRQLPTGNIGSRHDSVTAKVSTLVSQVLLQCPHWSPSYCYSVHIGLPVTATVPTLVSHLLLLIPYWSLIYCYSVHGGLSVTATVSTLVSHLLLLCPT